jgi:cytoskeletal protein RodZ
LLAKPAPPRPAKSSTLIGIGAPPPPRPRTEGEVRALSPGLLNVKTQVLPVANLPPDAGFPEPPPPPASSSELDWDWDEQTPSKKETEAAPESVDDFEELPPSEVPAVEELPLTAIEELPLTAVEELPPSSSGIPTLQTLTSRDEPAPPPIDDFFASMRNARGATNTLPLFELPGAPNPLFQAPAAAEAPVTPPELNVPPPEPSTEPRATADAQVPSSGRTRKHVIAPSTQSVPPPASAQRRSSLALPVLLVLALAAGFLIWKRSAAAPVLAVDSESQRGSSASTASEPVAAPPSSIPPTEPVPPPPAASDPMRASGAPSPLEEPDKAAPTSAIARGPTRSSPAVPKEDGPAKTSEKAAASPPEPDQPTPPETTPSKPKSETSEPTPPPSEPAGPFDRDAAAAALSSAAAQAASCRKPGDPSGVANVVITFAPSGRVTTATIGGPPFAGTPTGGCIASVLRKARVPAFEGDRVTVSKTIVIE